MIASSQAPRKHDTLHIVEHPSTGENRQYSRPDEEEIGDVRQEIEARTNDLEQILPKQEQRKNTQHDPCRLRRTRADGKEEGVSNRRSEQEPQRERERKGVQTLGDGTAERDGQAREQHGNCRREQKERAGEKAKQDVSRPRDRQR